MDIELKKHIELIQHYDRIFRSQVLWEAISLEESLATIIAKHFCSSDEKHELFFALIFQEGQISFAAKIKIFRKMLKICYPTWKPILDPWITRLDSIRDIRNKFAHGRLVLPNAAPTGLAAALSSEGVTLERFSGGKRVQEFIPETYIRSLVSDAKHLGIVGLLIQFLIDNRAQNPPSQSKEDSLLEDAKETLKQVVNDSI
jgi:hypothetical protein